MFAETSADLIAAGAALVVALIGLLANWVNGQKTKRVVQDVQAKVTTNNGKDAFQYLEMIEDLTGLMKDLRLTLVEHTLSDERNFQALMKDSRRKRSKRKKRDSKR